MHPNDKWGSLQQITFSLGLARKKRLRVVERIWERFLSRQAKGSGLNPLRWGRVGCGRGGRVIDLSMPQTWLLLHTRFEEHLFVTITPSIIIVSCRSFVEVMKGYVVCICRDIFSYISTIYRKKSWLLELSLSAARTRHMLQHGACVHGAFRTETFSLELKFSKLTLEFSKLTLKGLEGKQ